MLRYIATAAVAALLLAIAIKSRAAGESETADPVEALLPHEHDLVEVLDRPDGGREVTVRVRCASSVSRARLVYRLEGDRHTAHETSDCARSLRGDTGIERSGYVSEVELTGVIPPGASDVQLIVESETGERAANIELGS